MARASSSISYGRVNAFVLPGHVVTHSIYISLYDSYARVSSGAQECTPYALLSDVPTQNTEKPVHPKTYCPFCNIMMPLHVHGKTFLLIKFPFFSLLQHPTHKGEEGMAT